MRPGIVVQHGRLPTRSRELVRCDVTAILCFIPQHQWPEEVSPGDFVEVVLRREADLWSHPDREIFDQVAHRSVRSFFVNGGDTVHLFAVFVRTMHDLCDPLASEGVLAQLLYRLRSEDDISIIAAPSTAYMSCEVGRDGTVRPDAETFYEIILAHCQEMGNRFFIIDPPRGLRGGLLERWVSEFRSQNERNRSYGSIYYPWLKEGMDHFPPSCTIAGVFVRTERDHGRFGVLWPPANVLLQGVTHLEVDLSWSEAGALAEQSINPLVVQSGRGVVVFGARTLSRETAYQFINSRRVTSMIMDQLRRDNEWAVFELNNPHLWSVLSRDVRFRLEQFWQAGMLIGSDPEQNYAVVCDDSNNSQIERNAGVVNIEVRMCPVGTTEQIVLDLHLGGV